MKSVKSLLLGCMVFVISVAALGCRNTNTPQPTVDPVKEAYRADPAAYVVFERSTAPWYQYVTVEAIMNYQSQYPDCNNVWFRNQFSGEDLCIYNAYLYAMENRFINFELYVADNDKDFTYIREALSLDSPFLEQNFNKYGEHTWSLATNHIGERLSVRVEQFTQSRWDKKLEALEACRQIVLGIPETCVTQWEKAKYLYRYVCDHVEYVEYEKMADEDYFYDAVCKGQTVCDGYSNMLNLLFNLAGIESCEAMGQNIEDPSTATPEERENAGGHTWVVAKLDGQYYNFDPTWEDTKEGDYNGNLIYFGYSDQLAPVLYLDCEEMRPKCTDTSRDFLYADLIVDNITSTANVKKIANTMEQRFKEGKKTTAIGVTQIVTEKDYKQFSKKFGKYMKKVKKAEVSSVDYRDSSLFTLTAVS